MRKVGFAMKSLTKRPVQMEYIPNMRCDIGDAANRLLHFPSLLMRLRESSVGVANNLYQPVGCLGPDGNKDEADNDDGDTSWKGLFCGKWKQKDTQQKWNDDVRVEILFTNEPLLLSSTFLGLGKPSSDCTTIWLFCTSNLKQVRTISGQESQMKNPTFLYCYFCITQGSLLTHQQWKWEHGCFPVRSSMIASFWSTGSRMAGACCVVHCLLSGTFCMLPIYATFRV